jgi:hypothetical protein
MSPGFEGIFRFEARLMNRSERSLSGLMVAVTTVTHGHLVHNADGRPWGVGARVTVPQADDFADGLLSPMKGLTCRFGCASRSGSPSASRWRS